ncbi:putative amidohydrolase [Nocardioides ginsengisegetis]|uniref:Putative amidohydrolase n=1 Tax=Nocardioides ginsengisegetis TaxID=661491 RepID=A0A7W3IWU7_9ACTN|nr:putative amidohydrolase [Nocardioides ginsengisegetis]
MTVLRVAAAQATCTSGDVPANVATAARLVRLAGSQDVRLVLLPEAFLTGYDPGVFLGEVPALEGSWLDPLREAATETGAVVVASTPLARGSAKTLSMLVVRPGGEVTAPYDKQHLDADETPFFVPGDHGASITVDGLELGLSICYDSSFPEHARDAADAGAVGYLSSSAFFPGSAHRRDTALAARALDHGMYVVLAAMTGRCGPYDFIGGSVVLDPEGRPLARLDTEEGLAIADLDPALVEETRAVRRMHADRRATLGPRVRERA